MPGFQPSAYQTAIYDWVQSSRGSAVVIAVAGSGKTSTILASLPYMGTASAQLYAFNTAIAAELKARIPPDAFNVRASTFHSAGYRAICRALGLKRIETNSRKLQAICRVKLGWEDRRKYEATACRLVSLAKGSGVGTTLVEDSDEVWLEMIDYHDLDVELGTEQTVVKLARQLLAWSTEAAAENYSIDFDDQLYLPELWDLALDQTDWVIVDEAQDTNGIRRAMMGRTVKSGGRVLCVGDPCQAIYGFTGASQEAIGIIKDQWGAIELPLSVSYRCPQAVVELAQSLVPYIEPAPHAPLGTVRTSTSTLVLKELGPADAVLCRTNAPLVGLAYDCLSKGIPCQILGRDISTGLAKLVEKLEATNLDDLTEKLSDWEHREIKRYEDRDQPGKAAGVRDRASCLFTLIEHLPPADHRVQALLAVLDRLFSDDITQRLTLSSVHKAKGKEWPKVAILRPDLMPGPWAKQDWERQQERNVQYVAWTRAREALYFIQPDGAD